MNSTLELIEKLKNEPKRNEKKQILMDAYMNGERHFFIGAKLAYDYNITFGVKKVPEIMEDDGYEGKITFDDFLNLTSKLYKRELTGNAARDYINDIVNECHVPMWNNFYRRIILKNLNIGIESKTINEILKKISTIDEEALDYFIPTFNVQLATDGSSNDLIENLVGEYYVDAKLDGVRCLAILNKESSTVSLFSRNGLEFENFSEIKKDLEDIMNKIPSSIVFDGEIVSTDFQSLMKQVKRKENVDTSDTSYSIFDILTLEEFKAAESNRTQQERNEILSAVSYSYIDSKIININPKIKIDFSNKAGHAEFKEFYRSVVEQGYEGVMIKDIDSLYEFKRSKNWIKAKPKIDVSLTVIGIEKGDPNGKFGNTLGNLICEGTDLGKHIKTNVSSGMSEEDRDTWFNDPDLIMGMIVEIQSDKITLEDGGEYYSLRFPVFKGVRGTVKGEKI